MDTAEYAARHLPDLIHTALRVKVASSTSRTVDPKSISELLYSQITDFDRKIGNGVLDLCPTPKVWNRTQVQALVEGPNAVILRRANSGTTFTAALIDGERKNMWVVGLGDSSVGGEKSITP